MTVQDILNRSREQILDDGKNPKLWSDQDLLDYLNDALNDLCMATYCLKDSDTPAICQIGIAEVLGQGQTPGQGYFPYTFSLDSRVLKVVKARLSGATSNLIRKSSSWCDANLGSDWESETGEVIYYMDDRTTGSIRLYRKPIAAGTINMTVYRLPDTYVLPTDLEVEIGIPKMWHRELQHGICTRAYQKQDAETLDPKRSATHKELWNEHKERVRVQMIRFDSQDMIVAAPSGIF